MILKDMAQLKGREIPKIQLMLDTQERKIRTFLLNLLIASDRPIFPVEIMQEVKGTGLEVTAILKSLIAKGIVVLGEDGCLSGIYPVSAAASCHKIQLEDGRFLYAMCAIASFGIAFELGQNMCVSSSCGQCKREIFVDLANGEILSFSPATACVLYVPLGEKPDWSITCGKYVNFFCSKEHQEEWIVGNPSMKKSSVYSLNIAEAALTAKAIFEKTDLLSDGGKMTITSVEVLDLLEREKK